MQLQDKSLLGSLEISDAKHAHHNLTAPVLVEEAVRNREASLVATGAVSADTGKYTGRSPRDKFFVVRPESDGRIWWHPNNKRMSVAHFEGLLEKAKAYIENNPVYVQDVVACADPAYRLRVRAVTAYAWHSLFVRHLFRNPTTADLEDFEPDFTVVSLPGVHSDPEQDGTRTNMFVAIDLGRRIVLIGGTEYAGEIKKSIFTALQYFLPERHAMPMHCSANVGDDGNTAIFFGLSGTGKTTLSADPARHLIGDDEHGWSDGGVFNFEGGCYAKTINLSPQGEPEIWAATNRFSTVLENVPFDPQTRVPDYASQARTENTRSAYPLEAIPGVEPSGRGTHPRHVIFLSYDLFGVLPPVARLDSEEQIRFFFLSGYTSKVAGTERGMTGPEPTFSTCFAAPFLVLHPAEYADMLVKRVEQHRTSVWLINTGLVGGGYGTGERIGLDETRAIVSAIVEDRLAGAETRTDPVFGFQIPRSVPGVESRLLDPRRAWADPAAYDAAARRLKAMFDDNFRVFDQGGDAG
jgi:phosphoenolpyruvate carboxykinase (ATP)